MSERKIRSFIARAKKPDNQVREILCPDDINKLIENLPFQINQGSGKNLILKENTAVELGPPDRASFQNVLIAESSGLLRNGLITLIGPDISATPGQRLPFGQVIMVGGEQLKTVPLRDLERKQYISDRLPGYMVRSVSRRIWSRVSNEAFCRGFSFNILGRNLMAHYKKTFPQIQAMEILFLTSSDEDVNRLRDLLTEAQRPGTPGQSMKKLYGCTLETDCEDCPNRPICDRIREMAEQYGHQNKVDQAEMKRFAREILAMEVDRRH